MSSEAMGIPAARRTPSAAGSPHTRVEDVAALLTAAALASLGLLLLHAAGAVTGGTAGLSLLLAHTLPVPFGVVYAAITVPLVLVGVRHKGWDFTVRSVGAVCLVAVLSQLQPQAIALSRVSPLYGVVVGNLAVGVAMLILFRHRASLGGFNVLALLAQERRGWRAGYVQLVLDGLVVASSAGTIPGRTVLYSAAGVVVVNLVLAMNHRPGRYLDA